MRIACASCHPLLLVVTVLLLLMLLLLLSWLRVAPACSASLEAAKQHDTASDIWTAYASCAHSCCAFLSHSSHRLPWFSNCHTVLKFWHNGCRVLKAQVVSAARVCVHPPETPAVGCCPASLLLLLLPVATSLDGCTAFAATAAAAIPGGVKHLQRLACQPE